MKILYSPIEQNIPVIQRNNTYMTTPTATETHPPIIAFIMHFLFFIFSSRALESLSNCIDSSAIMDDFLYAVSSSPILFTNLLTFPFIISSSSSTLLLNASTLLFAFINLIKSSIFTLSLSLSF